jgi:hypothetical protein
MAVIDDSFSGTIGPSLGQIRKGTLNVFAISTGDQCDPVSHERDRPAFQPVSVAELDFDDAKGAWSEDSACALEKLFKNAFTYRT